MTAAQAWEDLEFAREQHRAHALSFDAFVFPRNSIGHLDELRNAGLHTFRGPDLGWFMAVGAAGRMASNCQFCRQIAADFSNASDRTSKW